MLTKSQQLGNVSVMNERKYGAEIRIWSAIGHTPITGRRGAYCDELAMECIDVAHPGEAREAAEKLKKQHPHAATAHFNVPSYPNQNIRTGWL